MNHFSTPRSGALAAYRALVAALAGLARGQLPESRVPHWLHPSALHAISMALPNAASAALTPVVRIALRDGIPGRAIPRSFNLQGSGEPVRLLAIRAPQAHAQAAPAVMRNGLNGTAAAVARDRLAPDRNYVLTCGHVVAPDRHARFNDVAQIGGGCVGYLAEWQPALGDQVYRTSLDAALLEVTQEDAIALRSDRNFLPAGVGGQFVRDAPVQLRRCTGPVEGELKVYWSGYVDLPGVTQGYPDYFLADAVGYRAFQLTVGGDSGAALWDHQESLLGMHIGALPDPGPGEANAVMSPIGPVLDWFNVQPYTRGNPGHFPPAPPTALRPGVLESADSVVTVVAQTLWGEARGESEAGMRAVGSVILTRTRLGWRGARDAADVCLAHAQFSCWNEQDPNRPKLERIPYAPDAAYRRARAIAEEVVAGTLAETAAGATHYVASTLRQRPAWLRAAHLCAVIGNHEFYNGIA